MFKLAVGIALIGAVIATIDDSERELHLVMHQVLKIRLPSNPTTGYSWSLANTSSAVIQLQSKPTFERKTGTDAVGAGGTEVWEFIAVQGGRQTLRFEYRRPWEKTAKPAKIVSFTILVR
jgi:inhibitor of cysteine peptidase